MATSSWGTDEQLRTNAQTLIGQGVKAADLAAHARNSGVPYDQLMRVLGANIAQYADAAYPAAERVAPAAPSDPLGLFNADGSVKAGANPFAGAQAGTGMINQTTAAAAPTKEQAYQTWLQANPNASASQKLVWFKDNGGSVDDVIRATGMSKDAIVSTLTQGGANAADVAQWAGVQIAGSSNAGGTTAGTPNAAASTDPSAAKINAYRAWQQANPNATAAAKLAYFRSNGITIAQVAQATGMTEPAIAAELKAGGIDDKTLSETGFGPRVATGTNSGEATGADPFAAKLAAGDYQGAYNLAKSQGLSNDQIATKINGLGTYGQTFTGAIIGSWAGNGAPNASTYKPPVAQVSTGTLAPATGYNATMIGDPTKVTASSYTAAQTAAPTATKVAQTGLIDAIKASSANASLVTAPDAVTAVGYDVTKAGPAAQAAAAQAAASKDVVAQQNGPASQWTAVTAGPAAQATASAWDAKLAGAADQTTFKGYTAQQSGDIERAGTTDYNATTKNVEDNALVDKQLNTLIDNNNPYMQAARTRAMQGAQKRGLINSSLAGTAGELAAIDRALPIAQQNATTWQNQNMANQGFINTADQFNAGAKNTAAIQNASEFNKNQQFNVGQANTVGLGNMQTENQVGMFNTGQSNQRAEFNTGQQNTVGMFNTGQANETSRFNTGETNKNNQFNVGQQNSVGTFNVGETNKNNQFNVGQANTVNMSNQAATNSVNTYNAGLINSTNQYNTGETNKRDQFNTGLINDAASFKANATNTANSENANRTLTANTTNANNLTTTANANATRTQTAATDTANINANIATDNTRATNTMASDDATRLNNTNLANTNQTNTALSNNATLGARANEFNANAANTNAITNAAATNAAARDLSTEQNANRRTQFQEEGNDARFNTGQTNASTLATQAQNVSLQMQQAGFENAKEVAAIGANASALATQSGQATGIYNTYMGNVVSIMNNNTMSAASKTAAINALNAGAISGLNLVGSIWGTDFGSILVYDK